VQIIPIPLTTSILTALALTLAAGVRDRRATPNEEPIRLELNVPAFRLDVWRDSTRLRSFPVAVGTPTFPTPRGEFTITQIIWNPWWIPPDREWARDEKITPPGPGNPMGRVKLLISPYYYIHGTPLEESIGSAASHGCIRMHNADAVVLAQLVQEALGIPVDDTTVARLARTRATRAVTLPTPALVTVVYRAAEVRADTLLLHPDVYHLIPNRVGEARQALIGAKVDSASIDDGALARYVRQARTTPVRVPIDSVRWPSLPGLILP